jgi:hypothetical protein
LFRIASIGPLDVPDAAGVDGIDGHDGLGGPADFQVFQDQDALRGERAGTVFGIAIGENLAEIIAGADRDFDVFVSHASSDKDSFVRPFAEALGALGVSVWFDEFVLKPGSSLRRSIDEGIRKARYGIVVLSPAFLGGRPWTEHELDGLVNGYVYNRQVLLPIWHGVDAEAVSAYRPSLADKVGIPTDDRTAADIAAEVARFIEESRSTNPVRS